MIDGCGEPPLSSTSFPQLQRNIKVSHVMSCRVMTYHVVFELCIYSTNLVIALSRMCSRYNGESAVIPIQQLYYSLSNPHVYHINGQILLFNRVQHIL